MHCNINSQFILRWLNPYFKKGVKEKFQPSDLFQIASNDEADFVTKKLCKYILVFFF